MSRYLLAQQECATHEQGMERARAQMKMSAYLSRKGKWDDAMQLISQVRQEYDGGSSTYMFALINFSEGIYQIAKNGVDAGVPKLLRAKALAASGGDDDGLLLLISAWLSHCYRVLHRWPELGREMVFAATYLKQAPASDEGLARLCLVIADSLQESGADQDSCRWYGLTRDLALKCGDDLTLAAMLYNRSSIHVFNLRVEEASGAEVDLVKGRVRLETESAENYAEYIGDITMSWDFGLLFGQIDLMDGRYADAMRRLDVLSVDAVRTWPNLDFVRRADILRCRAKLGEPLAISEEELLYQLDEARAVKFDPGDVGVATNSIYLALKGESAALSSEFEGISKKSLDLHIKTCAEEREVIERVMPDMDRQLMLKGVIS